MCADNQENKFSEVVLLAQRVNVLIIYPFDRYCQLGLSMNPTICNAQQRRLRVWNKPVQSSLTKERGGHIMKVRRAVGEGHCAS